MLPKQKPRINSMVRELLKERDAAFRSHEMQAYCDARGKLKRGIRDAKCQYKQHIEEQFSNNRYQGTDTLKREHFFAQCSLQPAPCTQPICCSLRHTERGDCPTHQPTSWSRWEWAVGPDCVPDRMLKTCVEQLTEVFTEITCHCSNMAEIFHHHSCD